MTPASNGWLAPFLARLGADRFADREFKLLAATFVRHQFHGRGDDVIGRHTNGSALHLVTAGWAARTFLSADGSRQITDFVMPGELCDFVAIEGTMAESVIALTDVSAAMLDRRQFISAIKCEPMIGLSLLRMALRQQRRLRRRLVNLGRYQKGQILAQLLCDLYARLRELEPLDPGSVDLPLNQEQVADATGMTAGHANRILRQLREDGSIDIARQRITILDYGKLLRASGEALPDRSAND